MFLPNVDFFLNSAFLQTHKNFNLPAKFLFFIITDENLDLTGLDAATATGLVVYEVLRWLEHFMCSCTNIF